MQDLLSKAITNLAFFIWTHELVPLDILLLALIDRDDDPYALRLVVSPLKTSDFHPIFLNHVILYKFCNHYLVTIYKLLDSLLFYSKPVQQLSVIKYNIKAANRFFQPFTHLVHALIVTRHTNGIHVN